MVVKNLKIITSGLVCVFMVNSCGLGNLATLNSGNKTNDSIESEKDKCIAKYVTMGTVGGAIIGLITNNDKKVTNAIKGAAVGAALSYLYAWGKCSEYFLNFESHQVANYQETVKKEKYNPKGGDIVKVREFSAVSPYVKPGDSLKLKGYYYVMSHNKYPDVEVVEKKFLYWYNPDKGDWELLIKREDKIRAELGSRKIDCNLEIPKEVATAKFKFNVEVESLGKADTASAEFYVVNRVSYTNIPAY